LDKDLKLSQFLDSDGTCKYLLVFNTAFNLLDSKVPFSNGSKMPLRIDNKDLWISYFKQINIFIRGLIHETLTISKQPPNTKKPKRDLRVVAGPRKKEFIGFLINMESYQAIFKLYVEEKLFLKYILAHKLSQDHLEMMFSTVRSSLGLNNNPTVQGSIFRSENDIYSAPPF
jgi:hypothetical protein